MTGERTMTRAEVQEQAQRIGAATGAVVRLDEPLAPLVSMRVGGKAAALIQPKDAQGVADVVRLLVEGAVPHVLLGGGSNLLVAERGLDFVVVHVAAAAAASRWQDNVVRASAAVPLAQLVREAIQHGRTGLEWAAGLPGTLGGAVAGNAGAFGGEIGASVREVVVLEPDGRLRTHVVADGDFNYRQSFVRPGEVVLEVVLALSSADPERVRDETNRVNRSRAGTQPKGGHSSGCIFKNPAGSSAGRLIDECGLKGLRVGGAVVSPSHGNFILNDGTATADDVIALIRMVRAGVKRERGIELELEVQAWPSREIVEGEP
jgi:UDP-N-acetylmuramate dehydrogenase